MRRQREDERGVVPGGWATRSLFLLPPARAIFLVPACPSWVIWSLWEHWGTGRCLGSELRDHRWGEYRNTKFPMDLVRQGESLPASPAPNPQCMPISPRRREGKGRGSTSLTVYFKKKLSCLKWLLNYSSDEVLKTGLDYINLQSLPPWLLPTPIQWVKGSKGSEEQLPEEKWNPLPTPTLTSEV